VLLVLCKIRHTPAAPQPPLSRGELPDSSFINQLFGGIPSREGGLLHDLKSMEEAGCVKIRITDTIEICFQFVKIYNRKYAAKEADS
jgi:hypothetical protein